MVPVVLLVVLVLLLFAVLELLNALYEAFHKGHTTALLESRGQPVPAPLWPLHAVRLLVGWIALAGERVSLLLHELAHALGQLVFLGRPRIVLCKNGGFAQARPWLPWRPAQWAFAIGQLLGRGVICMAPALVL